MGTSANAQAANALLAEPTRLTGAEIVWATLVGEGVTDVFGYPGGAILPVYDALRKFPIHHTLVRHEQGAAHMADGYARASGKVGVAIATSGPGATNLVTGIATAMLDSIPIVCITGNGYKTAEVIQDRLDAPVRLSRAFKDFEAWCTKMQLGFTRGTFGRWEWRGNPKANGEYKENRDSTANPT